MARLPLLILLLTGCSRPTAPAEDPWACQRDASGYGCDTLAPPVTDSLLPLSDSSGIVP